MGFCIDSRTVASGSGAGTSFGGGMGDIINLRQVRKDRARAEKEIKAQSNRAKFGRTKTERERQAQEAQRQSDGLENSRRENQDDTDKK